MTPRKLAATLATAFCMTFAAAPASAAALLDTCKPSDLTLQVQDCAGFSTQNLLAPNPWRVDAQVNALSQLGFSFDGDYDRVLKTMLWSNLDGAWTLSTPLTGTTFIGTSRRNSTTNQVETAFFKIIGAGETSFSLTGGKQSPVVFYNTNLAAAVPEPSTWLMLLLGFAGTGYMLRKRRKKNPEPRFRFGMSGQ